MDLFIDELLSSVVSRPNSLEIPLRLKRYAHELGFDYCAYGFRHPVPFTKPRVMKVSNYPRAWCELYEASGYVDIDPVVLRARKSQLPFTWSELPIGETSAFWEEVDRPEFHRHSRAV
ncbi:autoinducer binding domain-containing protein [Pandoraea sp. SD6-2]|uniref:autoinducer binding domain-containing protein n=1 Tax=Pandoraea sp. SD6-2 TaxID=1286093 RepID=UPI0009DBB994